MLTTFIGTLTDDDEANGVAIRAFVSNCYPGKKSLTLVWGGDSSLTLISSDKPTATTMDVLINAMAVVDSIMQSGPKDIRIAWKMFNAILSMDTQYHQALHEINGTSCDHEAP